MTSHATRLVILNLFREHFSPASDEHTPHPLTDSRSSMSRWLGLIWRIKILDQFLKDSKIDPEFCKDKKWAIFCQIPNWNAYACYVIHIKHEYTEGAVSSIIDPLFVIRQTNHAFCILRSE